MQKTKARDLRMECLTLSHLAASGIENSSEARSAGSCTENGIVMRDRMCVLEGENSDFFLFSIYPVLSVCLVFIVMIKNIGFN